MNKEYKYPSIPPWSSQKAGIFIRFLAWVYIVCGVIALSAYIYFSIVEGITKEYLLLFVGMLMLIIYSMLLFGHVAIKGKAPSGWLPW
jgi:hypothetical protein